MASIARFDEWQYTNGSKVNTVIQVWNTFITERSTWGVAASGGTVITPMRVTVTPKFSTSKILIQWMLNIESQNDMVFRIYKNGAQATNGTNPTDSNYWTGLLSAEYDNDNNSTPSNYYIQFIDNAVGSTGSTYYDIVAFSSGGAAGTVCLNRTFGASQPVYEITASSAIIMEVAQ